MNRSARRVLLRLFLLALPLVVLTLFATSLLTNSSVDSVHNHNALTFASEGKQISLISRAPLETRLELLSFFYLELPALIFLWWNGWLFFIYTYSPWIFVISTRLSSTNSAPSTRWTPVDVKKIVQYVNAIVVFNNNLWSGWGFHVLTFLVVYARISPFISCFFF